MASAVELELATGKKFESFEDLQDFMHRYQNKERQQFSVQHSRKLSNNIKRPINPALKYYNIRYVCKFGKQRNTESKGLRDSRTFKHDCPAFISIAVSKDGEYLQIKSFDTIHNGHDGSEEFFEHLPENRRLNIEEKMCATELLKLRCNKKFLQDKLSKDFNKIISQKDLTNLSSTLKSCDDDQLSKAVSLLEKTHGADVSILHEDNTFKGLYFSTHEMRNAMDAWPEIVFIDGTYKLFKRNFTLMILLVEDSEGVSRVAGVGVLSTEERETLKWFMNCFIQEHQAASTRIQCLMGDKDLTERDVIKQLLPTVPFYICMFHALRTFSREVSVTKMQISAEQRNLSLRYLDRLTKSCSEESYYQIYAEFSKAAPPIVLNYFNKNWHGIRHEWTKYSIVNGNLGNCTNNRLESINSKIKQVVKRNSTMSDFVTDFFKWFNNRDREHNYKQVQAQLKKDVQIFAAGTAEEAYKERLTKYAFTAVLEQIKLHNAVTIRNMDNDTKECLIESNNLTMKVSEQRCECSTWKSMCLPCRHIFAVRKHFGLSLFSEELCTERWTKQYSMGANTISQNPANLQAQAACDTSARRSVTKSIPPKKLTISQKRKLLAATMNDMVQVASHLSDARFLSQLNVLKEIQTYWRQGYDITVSRVGISSDDGSLSKIEPPKTDHVQFVTHESLSTTRKQNDECQSSMQCGTEEPNRGQNDIAANLCQSLGAITIESGKEVDYTTAGDTNTNLDQIELGVPIKMSGRPKGALLTTLGLPKRKYRASPFSEKTKDEKVIQILEWFLPAIIIQSVICGEYQVRMQDVLGLAPEELSDGVADEVVDLSIVQKYFEREAFKHVRNLVRDKKKLNIFHCKVCEERAQDDCILCNSCLLWVHFRCAKLKHAPKRDHWYCTDCKNAR